MKRSLPLLAALLVVAAAPAYAGSAEFGIGVFGGYNSYAMSDVNDNLLTVLDAVGGSSMDKISSGVGFGGGLRIRTSPALSFALDYERLNGTTSGVFDDGVNTANVDVKFPANAIVGTAMYYFPSASKARFGIMGGVGYYMADGTMEASSGGATAGVDFSGNGIGFHGGGAVDVAMSPTAHFEVLAGYRVAKTGDLEVDNTKIQDFAADWSGFMSRAGFSFFFGSH